MECLAHMLLHTSLHVFNMETECFEFIFCAVQDNWKKGIWNSFQVLVMHV